MKANIIIVAPELGKRYKLALSKDIQQLITAKHASDYIRKATPDIPDFVLMFNGEPLYDTDKIGYTDGHPIQLKIANVAMISGMRPSPPVLVEQSRTQWHTPAQKPRHNLTDVLTQFESGQYERMVKPVYEDAEVGQRIQHLRDMQQTIQSRQQYDRIDFSQAPQLQKSQQSIREGANQTRMLSNQAETAAPAVTDTQIADAIQARLQPRPPAIDTSQQAEFQMQSAGQVNQTLQPPQTPQTAVQRTVSEPKLDSPPAFHTITLTKRDGTPVAVKKPPKPPLVDDRLDEFRAELERLQTELQDARRPKQVENQADLTPRDDIFGPVQQKLDQIRQMKSQRESQLSDRSGLALSTAQAGKAETQISRGSPSPDLLERENSAIGERLQQLAEQQRKHEDFLRVQREQRDAAFLRERNQEIQQQNDNLARYLRFLEHQCEIFNQDFLNSNQLKCEVQNEVKMCKQQTKEKCLQPDKREGFELQLLVEKLRQVVTTKEGAEAQLAEVQKARQALHSELEDLKGNIRVFVRIRPILRGEQNLCRNIPVKMDDYLTVANQQEIRLKLPSATTVHGNQEFNFYRVYNGAADQKSVFSDVQPLLLSALDGYNLTILCYGATGSGKTFSLIGDDGEAAHPNDEFARLGILPRSVVHLFEQLETQNSVFELEVAMLELYCDQLSDMLSTEDCDLKIRFQDNQYFVQNLQYLRVTTADDLISTIAKGLENRHVGSTKINDRSSRSHALIYLRISRNNRRSVIVFGDLAGSERIEKSGSEGLRLKEAQFINSSLSALGDVVAALARKSPHIPFRNSKITQILQPGLGGNSKCLILVNLSPLWQNLHESFNSLVFASQIKQVRNAAVRRIFE